MFLPNLMTKMINEFKITLVNCTFSYFNMDDIYQFACIDVGL